MWKRIVIPAFRSILGAQTIPWDNTNPQLLVELKYIYGVTFPDDPRQIEHNGPEYSIVRSYQSKFELLMRNFKQGKPAWLRMANTHCPQSLTSHRGIPS